MWYIIIGKNKPYELFKEEEQMATVGIVMGSDSDMQVMSKAAEVLDQFGIDYDMRIISAHREPEIFFDYAKGAADAGMKVIIAGAGMAARRKGQPLFYSSDAFGHTGCNGSNRRRNKCGTACGKNAGHIR